MAMLSTALHRVNIQQVVSILPTLSTVLTLRDRILIRAVQQSRAVGHLDSHTLSTNITTILLHTVKGCVKFETQNDEMLKVGLENFPSHLKQTYPYLSQYLCSQAPGYPPAPYPHYSETGHALPANPPYPTGQSLHPSPQPDVWAHSGAYAPSQQQWPPVQQPQQNHYGNPVRPPHPPAWPGTGTGAPPPYQPKVCKCFSVPQKIFWFYYPNENNEERGTYSRRQTHSVTYSGDDALGLKKEKAHTLNSITCTMRKFFCPDVHHMVFVEMLLSKNEVCFIFLII